MKRLVFISLVLLGAKGFAGNADGKLLATPTYTKIVKSNGGLFGYKYVDETSTSNGSGGTNQLLACSDPGWNRCRFNSTARGVLTDNDYDAIDQTIFDAVTKSEEKKVSGQFVYNTEFLVVYYYHLSPNKLTYEIFTKDEAAAAGYTFQ